MSGKSGKISWEPEDAAIRAVVARFIPLGTISPTARKLKTTDATISTYRESGGQKVNAVKLLRYIADQSDEGRRAVAALFSLDAPEDLLDTELARRIALVRRAYQSDNELVRETLAHLETVLRFVARDDEPPAHAPPERGAEQAAGAQAPGARSRLLNGSRQRENET